MEHLPSEMYIEINKILNTSSSHNFIKTNKELYIIKDYTIDKRIKLFRQKFIGTQLVRAMKKSIVATIIQNMIHQILEERVYI